jgi:hypothetical protein
MVATPQSPLTDGPNIVNTAGTDSFLMIVFPFFMKRVAVATLRLPVRLFPDRSG